MDDFFFLFMINSILSALFFAWQIHLTSSIINSRCEKVEEVEIWWQGGG
jgi:hypothetical protein